MTCYHVLATEKEGGTIFVKPSGHRPLWGKAGDQALRRSAFQEAIAHLGKAIAMADKDEENKRAEHTGKRHSQTHLQTTYAYALLHARGHALLETRRFRSGERACGGL
jgi:predicted ATPase